MAVFKYMDCGTHFLGSNSSSAPLGQVPHLSEPCTCEMGTLIRKTLTSLGLWWWVITHLGAALRTCPAHGKYWLYEGKRLLKEIFSFQCANCLFLYVWTLISCLSLFISISPAKVILFKTLYLNVTKESSFKEDYAQLVPSFWEGSFFPLEVKEHLRRGHCSVFLRTVAEAGSNTACSFCLVKDQTIFGAIFGLSDFWCCPNSWLSCWHCWLKFPSGGSFIPLLIRVFNARANDVICNHMQLSNHMALACCYLWWRHLCF